MTFSLLTIMGKVKPTSVDTAREMHNQTAGNPGGVAAAKSLGDMSHMAFMPLDAATNFKGDILFMDIWNDVDGLRKFFSDPQVKAGGDMMFVSKEAVVWNKIESFLNFQFTAPSGNNDKIVGIIRGSVKSIAEAEAIHNPAIALNVQNPAARGLRALPGPWPRSW